MRCPPTITLVPEWFLVIFALAVLAVAFASCVYLLSRAGAHRRNRRDYSPQPRGRLG
ncbi:MAG: hypothetical protein IT340_20180 [Chloroflexi bacterium]|nr:hypothetical protein [Chloroflexota bacterium]